MRKLELEQQIARQLRHEGDSLREIAWKLEVSLSSVSLWVRGIPRRGAAEEIPSPPEPEQLSLERLRRCGRCGRRLPESAFNRYRTGHQGWCRECFRQYFRDRGALHRSQSEAARARRRSEAKRVVAEYLASHPCTDCGESDPVVLDFDHLREKRGAVSMLKGAGYGADTLLQEIAKCEVVCANCHRCRTASRGEWRRARVDWWRTDPPKRYETARNLAYAYSHLERSSCRDCGQDRMLLLDFDHVGVKTGDVLTLARAGVGLTRLEQEIAQCEIRCANCHRRATESRRADGAAEAG